MLTENRAETGQNSVSIRDLSLTNRNLDFSEEVLHLREKSIKFDSLISKFFFQLPRAIQMYSLTHTLTFVTEDQHR